MVYPPNSGRAEIAGILKKDARISRHPVLMDNVIDHSPKNDHLVVVKVGVSQLPTLL
jgi:hypothetical protein